jgi:hypothetical protein
MLGQLKIKLREEWNGMGNWREMGYIRKGQM